MGLYGNSGVVVYAAQIILETEPKSIEEEKNNEIQRTC